MPVAAHIDPDSRIVMFRCSGTVGIHEARRAFDHMMDDPAVESTRALWDLRSAAIAGRTRAIPDIIDMLQNRHPARVGGGRFAILVGEEYGPDVSTTVEKSMTTDTLLVRVFSSYAQASRWLGGEEL